MTKKLLLPLLCFSLKASAFVIGNPGQPWLLTAGVLPYQNKYLSLRGAFVEDYVYAQQFQGQIHDNEEEKPPIQQLYSETAQVTLNLVRRVDLYGIAGSAKMQMDREIFGRYAFAWGAGTKVLMYQNEAIQVGCDFKYFQTKQKPSYLFSSGMPLDLDSNLKLTYEEYQAAMGLSYRSDLFCPYLVATYLNAKIKPNHNKFLVNISGWNEQSEAKIHSFLNAHTWGMAVGASLLMGEKGTLTVESRFINQNGIDVSLEIRF